MRAKNSANAETGPFSGYGLATSRFEEDAVPPGHASVWGSWYCTETHCWGFQCCRTTQRNARPCRPLCAALVAFSASEAEPELHSAKVAGDLEWRPRESFSTSEGFVAFALRRLSRLWMAWLQDGTLGHARTSTGGLGSSAASVVLSEKAAREAASGIEEFCSRLYQQLLAPELVNKLQEMCVFIQAREYAQANKVYVDLAIGTRKWLTDLPVFVRFDAKRQDTDVSWTPDDGANPVDEAGVRSHVVLLRRLLTVSQVALPNPDPSKNCG